jgi:hypothetical protein
VYQLSGISGEFKYDSTKLYNPTIEPVTASDVATGFMVEPGRYRFCIYRSNATTNFYSSDGLARISFDCDATTIVDPHTFVFEHLEAANNMIEASMTEILSPMRWPNGCDDWLLYE